VQVVVQAAVEFVLRQPHRLHESPNVGGGERHAEVVEPLERAL
jgi:hypothetical protein